MDRDVQYSGEAAELSDAIGQLHALQGAALAAMFDVVRAYDEERAYLTDGAGSMSTWLAYALGVTFSTAAAYVRVAKALPGLPLTASAFREGRLCFEQVRALVPVATAANEADLLSRAAGLTATQIERMVRLMQAVSTAEAEQANDRRSLRMWWAPGELSLRMSGRLPAAEGTVVMTAIERLALEPGLPADEGGIDKPGIDEDSYRMRCADALVQLASAGLAGLAGDADADRACIVVHADAESLVAGEGGTAALECGLPLASETVRRLACDARVQVVVHGGDGRPVGIGRQSRVVPAALLRLLRHRDGGCRFPGCGRTRWLHAHHIRHWGDGGRTDLDNLVLLCGSHHRYVHEARWRIEGDPNVELHFSNRFGGDRRVAPPVLRREVAERIDATRLVPIWVPTPARC
ncbi:MAG: DUF222 domain-containing protein [Actinomycetota bacterium]